MNPEVSGCIGTRDFAVASRHVAYGDRSVRLEREYDMDLITTAQLWPK
jgi:hypothetical protein